MLVAPEVPDAYASAMGSSGILGLCHPHRVRGGFGCAFNTSSADGAGHFYCGIEPRADGEGGAARETARCGTHLIAPILFVRLSKG